MVEETEPIEAGLVQSVGKAAALLRCFVDVDDGMTLTVLARRTGMLPSTALRLLRTLCATGLLSRAEGSEVYVRGPVLLALAQRSFLDADLGDALGVLEGLALDLGESVNLDVRDGTCSVILLQATGPDPLPFERRVGARIPLHATASGKVLLAFGPQPVTEAVAALGPLVPLTSLTVDDPSRLLDQVEAARAEGYASSVEESTVGAGALAVPVLDAEGGARASVSIQGPLARMERWRRADAVAALRSAAAQLAESTMFDRLPVLRTAQNMT